MAKAVRSRDPRTLAHHTRRLTKPSPSNYRGNGHWPNRNGHPLNRNGNHGLEVPPPAFVRHRTRTDRPWYAKEIRRHGQRFFGFAFSVVTITPAAKGAAREFVQDAAVCWLVGAISCVLLWLLPKGAIAIGGTAVILLLAHLLMRMIGEDDLRVYDERHTGAQIVCLATQACLVAMAGALLWWALLFPVREVTINIFGLFGFVLFFATVIAFVALMVPVMFYALALLNQTYPWERSELVVLPSIPLLLVFCAVFARL